jgi:hypothetical protein
MLGATPVLPSDGTIRAIGGHPAIAKVASRLIARQGPTVFEHDPRGLHLIQEDILRESLDVAALSTVEAESSGSPARPSGMDVRVLDT